MKLLKLLINSMTAIGALIVLAMNLFLAFSQHSRGNDASAAFHMAAATFFIIVVRSTLEDDAQ